jgi:DNA-binding transcriptional MerR regulator
MPTDTFTPAQAAAVLDVHSNTVRLWTREYADVLSASARGRPRLLTPRDVALLQVVKQLRAEEKLAPDAILERLRQLPDTDVQQPSIDVTTDVTVPAVDSTAPATLDVASALRDILAHMDTQTADVRRDVRQLDERLRSLESRRTLWIGFAVGAITTLLLALMLAAVLLRVV